MKIEVLSSNPSALLNDINFVIGLMGTGSNKSRQPHSSSSKDDTAETANIAEEAPPEETTQASNKPKKQPIDDADFGEQVFLLEVNSSVVGNYNGLGNIFIKKAGRKCACIRIKIKDKDYYIVGSFFKKEEEQIASLNLGDQIKIEKTVQFVKAVERSHAQAAKFKITKLKQTS